MTTKKRTPMKLQPFSGGHNLPTQMPMPKSSSRKADIADIIAEKGVKHVPVKDPAQTAKARAMRLASLRKQRDATRT